MEVHPSALKHEIDATSAAHAASTAIYIADLDDESPARQFRLGFDDSGRLLELVVLRFDSGRELVIHAMKARAQYFDLLP
ncbi:MAG: toxin [Actinomycetota bacterium]|nr:toxin [Actinomycetota bacterium]MDP2288893.1 toxin [Actinomycetota bacterium]